MENVTESTFPRQENPRESLHTSPLRDSNSFPEAQEQTPPTLESMFRLIGAELDRERENERHLHDQQVKSLRYHMQEKIEEIAELQEKVEALALENNKLASEKKSVLESEAALKEKINRMEKDNQCDQNCQALENRENEARVANQHSNDQFSNEKPSVEATEDGKIVRDRETIYSAICSEDFQLIYSLVKQRGSLSSLFSPSLVDAICEHSQAEATQRFLDYLDVNELFSLLCFASQEGISSMIPLFFSRWRKLLGHAAMISIAHGHCQMAKALIVDAGGVLEKNTSNEQIARDIHSVDKMQWEDMLPQEGKSALHYAAFHGHKDLVSFLLSKGMPVDATDKLGRTPLHEASCQNHASIIEILMLQGANFEHKDKQNLTPIQIAKECNAKNAIDVFQDPKLCFLNVASRGNSLYNSKDYKSAAEAFTRALCICGAEKAESNSSGKVEDQPKLLCTSSDIDKATLLYNRARARFRLGQHTKAIDDCTAAILLDSSYCSAYAQRAECLMVMFEFDKAVEDLTMLKSLEPDNLDWEKKLEEAKSLQNMDYYELLGIDQSASALEIKKAYKKASLKWHPDKNRQTEDMLTRASTLFKRISEANMMLSDSTKRQQYDLELELKRSLNQMRDFSSGVYRDDYSKRSEAHSNSDPFYGKNNQRSHAQTTRGSQHTRTQSDGFRDFNSQSRPYDESGSFFPSFGSMFGKRSGSVPNTQKKPWMKENSKSSINGSDYTRRNNTNEKGNEQSHYAQTQANSTGSNFRERQYQRNTSHQPKQERSTNPQSKPASKEGTDSYGKYAQNAGQENYRPGYAAKHRAGWHKHQANYRAKFNDHPSSLQENGDDLSPLDSDYSYESGQEAKSRPTEQNYDSSASSSASARMDPKDESRTKPSSQKSQHSAYFASDWSCPQDYEQEATISSGEFASMFARATQSDMFDSLFMEEPELGHSSEFFPATSASHAESSDPMFWSFDPMHERDSLRDSGLFSALRNFGIDPTKEYWNRSYPYDTQSHDSEESYKDTEVDPRDAHYQAEIPSAKKSTQREHQSSQKLHRSNTSFGQQGQSNSPVDQREVGKEKEKEMATSSPSANTSTKDSQKGTSPAQDKQEEFPRAYAPRRPSSTPEPKLSPEEQREKSNSFPSSGLRRFVHSTQNTPSTETNTSPLYGEDQKDSKGLGRTNSMTSVYSKA